VEPGLYYRDFEKETLRHGLLLPPYPASKHLCALGGMLGNNAGGEKSLRAGKVQDYVRELKAVLADGNEYTLKQLTRRELEEKMRQKNFEGVLYLRLHALLETHYDLIGRAKPEVSKNSSGYNLWDIWDRQTFDLTKLFVGSQGTLGLVTQATLRLLPVQPASGLAVIFLDDLRAVAELVGLILPLGPTSMESFDDHTFRLAMKFLPDFMKILRPKNVVSLALQFLPEFWLVLRHGMPKLVLLVAFEGQSSQEVEEKLRALTAKLKGKRVRIKIAKTSAEAEKYWAIRRESFNLLRQRVKGLETAPFIDDLVVRPEKLPQFLPKLYALLDRYQLLYTVAGHVGDGNFHVIPLMKLADETERKKIPAVAEEVYNLVAAFGGSFSGEHNDGLIRTPYLPKMFGNEVVRLFEEVKRIFDPQNLFNPGKKVGGSAEYALAHLKRG
jgi:FAD/FMN-containing dehydrogenase